MAMVRGGYAEYVTVDARRALFVPDRLSWAEAGATPTTFCTAHDALATAGQLDSGEAVLVNAASSGVGVAALQLARLLGAGPVIGVSTSAGKLEALAEAGVGPDHGFLSDDPDIVDRVLEVTAGRGVHVTVDNVGGPAWPTNLAVAALGGRIVSVGRVGGNDATVNLDEVARKRVSLVGVTFRTRDAAQTAAVVSSFAVTGLSALADGRIRPLVHRTYPLEEAAAAQADLAANRHVGKLVLEVD
jgi:NADPH:quinone reductase-like Zn-dependent oxidoreductase